MEPDVLNLLRMLPVTRTERPIYIDIAGDYIHSRFRGMDTATVSRFSVDLAELLRQTFEAGIAHEQRCRNSIRNSLPRVELVLETNVNGD